MLIDRLEERASTGSTESLLTWIDDGGKEEAELTAFRLLERVATLSGFLRGPCGLRPGDRALLIYPPSLAFVEAFIGCLYAGVIPVPCYPPDPRVREQVARIDALAREASTRVALTCSRFRWAQRIASVSNLLSRARAAGSELTWYVTDEVKTGAFPAQRHRPAPHDVAFLQYTSGSTAAPRGVALSFANLHHQLMLNARLLGLDATARAVLWVPQYHDLGLISGIASAVYGNGHLYAMSPLAFLSRPALWAELITRTRATHTASPHFGYALLLRKTTAEQRARFDFSHLRVLMSAGEPIHAETMERFFAAFAASGLRRAAWCPAYGLAEHTVGVTIGGQKVLRADRAMLEKHGEYRPAPEGAPASAMAMLVGCGQAEPEVTVRIVEPQSRHALPDGVVGEIWVDSPSKASAYFGRTEETEALLQARIDGAQGDRGYLRTGDLGLLHEGELFVTGRIKDLIIVAGRNVAAVDVEEAVRAATPQVRPGGIAAVSVADARGDGEAVALVLEATTDKLDVGASRTIADTARAAVLAQLRVPVAAVLVGAPGLVPKTTSGKPQRRACRDALRADTLARHPAFRHRFDFDLSYPPEGAAAGGEARGAQLQSLPACLRELPVADRRDALIAALQEAVARALGRGEPHLFEPYAPLASFGLDSMILVELADELSTLVEAPLTLALVAALPNLASLAAFLLREVLHLEFVDADTHRGDAEMPRCQLHTRTWQPAPSSRIAVVGAGCAGLVAAMELARRGHRDVTILEALPRLGGKVRTDSHAGVNFEMGQLLFGQQYRTIWQLALDVGCSFVSDPDTDFLQDNSGERTELRTTQKIKDFYEAMFAAAALDPTSPPEAAVEHVPEDLLMPVGSWLRKHGLDRPPPAFLTAWTGCGYGYLGDEVPAWFLLRYARIINSANVLPLAIKGGNQALWEGVARVLQQQHGFAVRLGAAVTGYTANEAGVSLAVADTDPERFDAVIFALPAHALAPLLSAAQREPFARFRHYAYRAAAFEADGLPKHVRSIHFAEAERSHTPGAVLALSRAHSSPRGFLAGQYIARPGEVALSDAVLDEKLDAQLEKLGLHVTARRGNARWSYYFPHLSPVDLQRGTLQEIEAAQGRNRTFYTGSYLALETLEHVARHAQSIVRAFF